MASTFKDIRAAIKAVIDAQADAVKVCYNYERSTFEGMPAAVVVPTDNEAAYGSTRDDRDVFVFRIKMYYEIKKEDEHEAAEGYLETTLDQMLTIFRNRAVLGAAVDWVEPAPSIWYYEEVGEGVYRVAELTLRCVKYIDKTAS